MYNHVKESFKHPNKELTRERLLAWRREPSVQKIDKPTNLPSARRLGYKAKQGIIVVRVKLPRGGRMRPQIRKGRRTTHMRRFKILDKNYRAVAEERAAKKFKNLEVLNSYKILKDGLYYWFEVIMVDPHQSVIKSDKNLSWMINHRGRVSHGLTSAGKKSRGLRAKGIGAERMRPSRRLNIKRRLRNDNIG
ncbi:50S ribosomal protein L15e [Candidatus Woesearchaeota archaeon]|nr:50S ribosomal protein L15e [Candidatus Woesearchaeota archaeon]